MTREEQREYMRAWRERHPNYYKDYGAKYRAENPDYYRNYRAAHPEYRASIIRAKQQRAIRQKTIKESLRCKSCGELDIAKLHFHHKNPREKERTIGQVWGHWSDEHLLKEIVKCEVLCLQCHFALHKRIGRQGITIDE